MPKAYVNPEDLRRFAMDLKRFNDDLKGEISGIHHRFTKLGESWQDQEHAKFADAADKHIPFLLRKAERIQEYLDQR